jgi:anti-sigma regulatory factor (Ser/Thr protein kinase)
VTPEWTPRPQNASVFPVSTVREARQVVDFSVIDGWTARADEITLAVHELAANALRETGAVELASWVADNMLVLEVNDEGPGLSDPLRGYAPPGAQMESGRGMWLAWSLADDAVSSTSPAGTSIRVFFRHP